MHEFMHGLGFQHSSIPERDGLCEAGGDIAGTYYTPYDPRASPTLRIVRIRPQTRTSAVGNICGLRVAYGKKPGGVLVNSYNACLDIDATGGHRAVPPDPKRRVQRRRGQLWLYNATKAIR